MIKKGGPEKDETSVRLTSIGKPADAAQAKTRESAVESKNDSNVAKSMQKKYGVLMLILIATAMLLSSDRSQSKKADAEILDALKKRIPEFDIKKVTADGSKKTETEKRVEFLRKKLDKMIVFKASAADNNADKISIGYYDHRGKITDDSEINGKAEAEFALKFLETVKALIEYENKLKKERQSKK